MEDGPLARQCKDLLDEVGAEGLTPGAGSVAALVGALAAAVSECVARMSSEQAGDASDALSQAVALRERLVLLADANAAAYSEASRSLGRDAPDDAVRDNRLGSDLALAAYTPLSIAEVAADTAELAAVLAKGANPEVRADAVAAACLAEGAARAAAHLVRINLGMAPADERIATAQAHADAAAAARAKALDQAPRG